MRGEEFKGSLFRRARRPRRAAGAVTRMRDWGIFSGRPVSVPYDLRGLKSTHIRSGRTLAGHFRDVGDAVPYGLLNCYSRGMGGAQDRGEER